MLKQKELFDNLSKLLGSPYAACMYLAKTARNQQAELHNLISESEAITWALTNELPKNYEVRLNARSKLLSNVEDILNYVEDSEVEIAARQSFRDSIQCEHLVYNYLKIEDESRQSRVRILTRMMFYKFKEDSEICLRKNHK